MRRLLAELSQVDLARLVRAVLAPHDRIHVQLGVGRPATEDGADLRVLVVGQPELAVGLRFAGRRGGPLDRIDTVEREHTEPVVDALGLRNRGRRSRGRRHGTRTAAVRVTRRRLRRAGRLGRRTRCEAGPARGVRRLVVSDRHARTPARRPARPVATALMIDVKNPRPSTDGPVNAVDRVFGMRHDARRRCRPRCGWRRYRASSRSGCRRRTGRRCGSSTVKLVERRGIGDVATLAVLDRDDDLLADAEIAEPGRVGATRRAAAGPDCGSADGCCGSARRAADAPRTAPGSRCRCRAPAARHAPRR